MTTLTCIADYMSWTTVSNHEKLALGYLYVPYLAVCKSAATREETRLTRILAVFMGVDMFARLDKMISKTISDPKKRN